MDTRIENFSQGRILLWAVLLLLVILLAVVACERRNPPPAIASSDINASQIESLRIQTEKMNKSLDSLHVLFHKRQTVQNLITNINNSYENEKNHIVAMSDDSATMYLTNWVDSLRYTQASKMPNKIRH